MGGGRYRGVASGGQYMATVALSYYGAEIAQLNGRIQETQRDVNPATASMAAIRSYARRGIAAA